MNRIGKRRINRNIKQIKGLQKKHTKGAFGKLPQHLADERVRKIKQKIEKTITADFDKKTQNKPKIEGKRQNMTVSDQKRGQIMNDFCVDLELAKELKENGFPQDTYFIWHCYKSKEFCIEQNTLQYRQNKQMPDSGLANDYSAPFSDEILKELPIELWGCILQIDRTSVAYYVWYLPTIEEQDKRPSKDICPGHTDKKLCNALARMWLYLKKEGYIK